MTFAGACSLEQAVRDRDMDKVSRLLERGSEPVEKDAALSIAAGRCEPAITEALLKAGAHPNRSAKPSEDPEGTELQPLHQVLGGLWMRRSYTNDADRFPCVETARVLIRHRADVNISEPGNRATLVGRAISYSVATLEKKGYREMAELLLEHGADPNREDSNGLNAAEYLLVDIPGNRRSAIWWLDRLAERGTVPDLQQVLSALIKQYVATIEGYYTTPRRTNLMGGIYIDDARDMDREKSQISSMFATIGMTVVLAKEAGVALNDNWMLHHVVEARAKDNRFWRIPEYLELQHLLLLLGATPTDDDAAQIARLDEAAARDAATRDRDRMAALRIIKDAVVVVGSLTALNEKLKDYEANSYDRAPAGAKKNKCSRDPAYGYFVMDELPASGPRGKGFKIRCYDARRPNGHQSHIVRYYPSEGGWAGGNFLDDVAPAVVKRFEEAAERKCCPLL